MKHVRDITDNLNPATDLATVPELQTLKVDKCTATIVNQVFSKLQGIFPAWRQAWPDDESLKRAKREWIAGFVRAGIRTEAQLAFGFEAARHSTQDFIPCVGKFISWCAPSPAQFGMPSEDEAWYEALWQTYSHPAVRVAAEATGLFELRTAQQGDSVLRQRFERNYAIVLRRAQNGQPLCGRIAAGIGHDRYKTPCQRAEELAEQQLHTRILKQGIPADGASARALLLATMNVHRDDHSEDSS